MVLGRSMTLLGFVILLLVALSACGKKDQVGSPDGVDIFDIGLPHRESPFLRDYTAADLGAGVYEVKRLGFKIDSTGGGPSYSGEIRHDLAVNGSVQPQQDHITGEMTSGAQLAELGFSFLLHQRVEIRPYPVPSDRYSYVGEIDSNQFVTVREDYFADLTLISEHLQASNGNRVARGVYEATSDWTTVYVVKTEVGFSLHFVVYDPVEQARVVGRIDYLKVAP